jgi:hypothetical protein
MITCKVCGNLKNPYKNEQYICVDCADSLRQQLCCTNGAKQWTYLYFNERTGVYTVSPTMCCPSRACYNEFARAFEYNKYKLSSSCAGSAMPDLDIEQEDLPRIATEIQCPKCKCNIMIYDVRVGRQWLLVDESEGQQDD